MVKKKVTRGVILAAGDGGRMGQLTRRLPKVLLHVKDKPLIFYAIESMLNAGIYEIAIVVGYLRKQMETILQGNGLRNHISFIYNPDYLGGNALSVNVAGKWAQGEPFVLCMGDHMVDTQFVRSFLEGLNTSEKLGVDYCPGSHHVIDEATKVAVTQDGKIQQIGKGIEKWNALDTGVFIISANFLKTLQELIPYMGNNIEISDVIRSMILKRQSFYTQDMSGLFWADVDTPDDLVMVSGGIL